MIWTRNDVAIMARFKLFGYDGWNNMIILLFCWVNYGNSHRTTDHSLTQPPCGLEANTHSCVSWGVASRTRRLPQPHGWIQYPQQFGAKAKAKPLQGTSA
mmetsp:Transcript_5554/g.13898  ORF Transcript_5554/g.13898 Transcript_5554/m.13898 type:complete len:100 (-) Transcript_5554:36-335(-)